MKVYINFANIVGPYGGANQFLKALSAEFDRLGIRGSTFEESDVILINSFHAIDVLVTRHKQLSRKIIVHRIDGLERLRDPGLAWRDSLVKSVNKVFADGTVFQSLWSQVENLRWGIGFSPYQEQIFNAPDPGFFNLNGKLPFSSDRKIRLVAVSWSTNKSKGFDVIQWLDAHLDFSRYEMTFVGNAPQELRNIRVLSPLSSPELALFLKTNDIFIMPGRNEACSNALIEALHCGLPALALRHSSNPQIVGGCGELFNDPAEIPALLEHMVVHYGDYASKMDLPSIQSVGKQYESFIRKIWQDFINKDYRPKSKSFREVIMIWLLLRIFWILDFLSWARQRIGTKISAVPHKLF